MPNTAPARLSFRGSRGGLGPLALLVVALSASPSHAHDIPNARVDRSTQVTLRPGTLTVVYEVSLAELTLTQELRSLIGSLPGADRRDWFAAYGRETGPLNAKGLLVTVDETPVELRSDGFDLVVEEHPRYLFRYRADLPARGRLRVRDTNFGSSEGTSRLAVKGEGVAVRGDDLPSDVALIPARPVWQLSDEEERRTREARVEFEAAGAAPEGGPRPVPAVAPVRSGGGRRDGSASLSRLLDDALRLPVALLALSAFGLGAAHAFQPGHGQTLVAATVVAEGGNWLRGALLAAVTTLAHTGSVALIAVGLWWTGSVSFPGIHEALTRSSGFLIAAVGLWRVGRRAAGFPEHAPGPDGPVTVAAGPGGLIGLGLAGGIVPCWDAIGLVVLAAAVGRLGLGLVLVGAFSAGMGLVLVAVGWAVSRLRHVLGAGGLGAAWERRLGLASGTVLAALGVYLLRP
jgi:ABC-type nickel/cobalt efflux system permease component RcnA